MKTKKQSEPDSVDQNQDLTIEQAADRLANDECVLADCFPDFTEEMICISYPEPVVLEPWEFHGLQRKSIIAHLRGYERFKVYP